MHYGNQKPQGSYISHFSNLVKAHGGINLAQGIPGFMPPPLLLDELERIVRENVHQYAPGIGNFKLLNLLEEHYSLCANVEVNNFLIVQGATEALSLVYTYVRQLHGDKFSVMAFEPAYESYSQLPKIFGQRFISQPLNDALSFDSGELERVIVDENVKLVFLASPGNPFGKTWSKQEVESLVAMAQRLNFHLIFDAVYKELYFSAPSYIPLELSSPNVFYVNSFSKTLCVTGWRIGYVCANVEHTKALRAIHDYVGLCAPSILQEALANYLAASNYGEEFVSNFRREVSQNFMYLASKLKQLGFTIPQTNGGCFVWAQLPKAFPDGFEFATSLYSEAAVAVIPGEHFSKNHTDWIRLNVARPFVEIEEGARKIRDFMLSGAASL